jgi:hypothetical protein
MGMGVGAFCLWRAKKHLDGKFGTFQKPAIDLWQCRIRHWPADPFAARYFFLKDTDTIGKFLQLQSQILPRCAHSCVSNPLSDNHV